MFKEFVASNRPSLDIEDVATGETWFGSQALAKGLCDEIKAADDVLTEYVDNGFNVYSVEYKEPSELGDLKSLLTAESPKEPGLIQRGIRWLVQTVSNEIRSEIAVTGSPGRGGTSVDQQYMIRDDSADRYRM